ncbi:class I adenylate-forming enzyme family protein [Halocalculus aciditolerans]|uniref:Long-chain-fatty-acid--CoA ligase n=1 Tax=Halocalculus aciditolerans TaxID=1383812 RepID=A0A830FEY4_9EURY|nr:AMP-binding protein [Halocalculus aciditolerans]GGL48392.1 long-chain-fatty-acid--CoA ligase [Halocalculus aciditolerans]
MDVPTEFREHEGNAARLFTATAERRGDALAVEMGGAELSYAELDARAASFAGGLAEMGLEPGDRALVYLPNCPQYVVAILGGLRAGVVLSPVNPQYKSRELAYQLDDADADAVVTHAALREHLDGAFEETGRSPLVVTVGDEVPEADAAFEDVAGDPVLVERDSDDTAMQPYTSGTTGQPKGVLTTHGNLRAQGFAGFGFTDLDPDDQRELAVLPLYHITGFVHSTWQTLLYGGEVHLRSPGEWDAAEAMATIEEYEITGFVGVATMFVDMVNHDSFGDHDLSSLDTVNEGGAKMPVAVQERFEGETGVEMSEGYGLTETTAATHTGVGSSFGAKPGTIGQPLRMTDCRVVDADGDPVPVGAEGELLVRGPQVAKGYHNLPEANDEAFTEDGFFRTGDVARRDAENYYEIVDRKKHMINTAGYNVYPSEVEELLYEHDGVADAAVVGVPDERRNETVKAFVVPVPDSDVTPEAIKQFCLDSLAEYKHPREVEFVDELPRTASGKIQKFKLVEGDGGDAA